MADIVVENNNIGYAIFTAIIAVIIVVYIYLTSSKNEEEPSKVVNDDPKTERKDVGKSSKKKKSATDKRKDTKVQFSHPWLLNTLKGHGGNILDMDFSSNGKYLASCGEDRTIMLWNVKSFNPKDVKSVRINVEYDHATQVKWSPDGKAFLICQANRNALQVYRVSKKDEGMLGNAEPILAFPEKHKEEIIYAGIACTGRYIMSCSKDTTMIIWDLKGEVLTSVDTLCINNYYACISPCGRFVSSSGFTPDVKVWEVCFTKTGEFKEVKRAFELKGHTSGIYCFSFSNDSTRMASVSKDNTWKLWDTNIEYQKGQEPYLLQTGNFNSQNPCLISLSPDGRTVAIASLSDICIYSGVTGEKQDTLEEVHTEPINVLQFSPTSQHLLAAAGRHIRIFHNVPGYQNTIKDLELKKQLATTQSIKDRLQSQLDDAKANLKSMQSLLQR